MKKKTPLFQMQIGEDTASKFSYIGASAAFILAVITIPLFFPGSPVGWYALPDTLILLLGGWGILKGKRLVSIILPAYALASRYIVNETLGHTGADIIASFFIFPAYILGAIGAFARDRAARIKAAAEDPRWIDTDIAVSFTRTAGIAGICFGLFVGLFALLEIAPFTRFNLTDAFLITLFAWHTVKRRLWAAAAQLILNLVNMAVSYSQTGSFSGAFGFIPLFLFELYCLGFIGTAVLRRASNPAEREQSIESGTGGPPPLTQDRPSPEFNNVRHYDPENTQKDLG